MVVPSMNEEQNSKSTSDEDVRTDRNGNEAPKPRSRRDSKTESRSDSRRSSCSFASANEDFLMVDLVSFQ